MYSLWSGDGAATIPPRSPVRFFAAARHDDFLGDLADPAWGYPEGWGLLEILDLSLGGLHGVSNASLCTGETVTLNIPSARSAPPRLHVTGRVIRCDYQDGRFDVAVEFGQTRDDVEASPWHRLPELFLPGLQPESGRPRQEVSLR